MSEEDLMNTPGFVLNARQVVPSATVNNIDFGTVRTFMRMRPGTAHEPTTPNA